MNIAFEISPLITASGTFGDKSGVYRYTYGLLTHLIDKMILEDPKTQIVLFTFAPTMLSFSLNPEIFALIQRKNITLYGYDKKINIKKIRGNFLSDWLYIPFLKTVLSILDKIIHFRAIYAKLKDDLKFKKYIKELETNFKKLDVKIVFHSETGFFPLQGFKNIITIYDLTTILIPAFHRGETVDLQTRKIRFTKNFCDAVIAISESTRNDLLGYSDSFKKKKIIVGYPGLDSNFISVNALDMNNLNKIVNQLHTKLESKKYFLYYGTFEPRKNAVYIVRAFEELKENNEIPPDFKLILIGGKGWGKVKQLVQDFIIENYPFPNNSPVVLLDYIHDKYLYSFIKHAYAVVYPSFYEGFGLPVLESMSIGTPVICSDTSSLPEVGGDAVIYVNPKDYYDVKEKMKYLVNNPQVTTELSKKGVEQSKKFNWTDTAEKVYSFLNEL